MSLKTQTHTFDKLYCLVNNRTERILNPEFAFMLLFFINFSLSGNLFNLLSLQSLCINYYKQQVYLYTLNGVYIQCREYVESGGRELFISKNGWMVTRSILLKGYGQCY